jgi:RNA polymerase sigma-70 factor, ECF subfamily
LVIAGAVIDRVWKLVAALTSQIAEWDLSEDITNRSLDDLARTEFQFIWRTIRRLGVWPDDIVDDAAQRVFEIATEKWHLVQAGKERAYLYRTAALVAAEKRRARRVGQREQPDERVLQAAKASGAEPDSMCQERQYRACLDIVLESLSDELREVFVLYELERQNTAEIAELLDLKPGTVASRLRRAREAFQEAALRLRKRLEFSGDLP